MIHVQAKLGTVLRRTGRPNEAEARYRRTVELAGTHIEHAPTNVRARMDRADTREALALLEDERGRRGRARAMLEAAAADLQSIATAGPTPSVSDRFDDYAEDYRSPGNRDRADEMDRWAGTFRGARTGPPMPR